MRTTLDLDDRVLAAARALAHSEGISLGAAVSRLARRGLEPTLRGASSGFPVFDVGADAPPITLEIVNAHRDDD
jgi:hypothetical protein